MALVFGSLFSLLVLDLVGVGVSSWWVAGGAAALALVGFLDDRGGLSARFRLAAQVIIGILFGAALGGAFLAMVGAFAIPAIVNAVNFMDGINGISALATLSWGCFAVLAGFAFGWEDIALLGAVLAGSSVGFLPWNSPIARMFLGDVGSYFIGGWIAFSFLLALAGSGGASGLQSIILIAPLAVYFADTGSTLARRAWRGARLGEAHREHTYQRLVDLPRSSHIKVAAFVALLGFVCAVCTLWSFLVPIIPLLLAIYLFSPRLLASAAR